MNGAPSASRRRFLIAGAGLTFAFALPLPARVRGAAGAAAGQFGAWVHIAADDTVTVRVPAAELGQGSMTAQALILAEELDADWARVHIEFAPPDDRVYANPVFWAFGIMLTAGSTGVQAYYERLRLAGAQVRRVLLDEAARTWGVAAVDLGTELGMVVHPASSRRLSYGAIAAQARLPAVLPELTAADLKPRQAFRLIGHDQPRRDVAGKTRGAALYSIDVRLPGMLHATVVHAPRAGGVPVRIDDGAAREVPGVVHVGPIGSSVAIAARGHAAVFAAERKLRVDWRNDSPARVPDSDTALDAHAAVARDTHERGFIVHESGDFDAAFGASARRHEAEYRTDFLYHAQLEPLNAVARMLDGGRGVEIWAGTQTPTHLVRSVAQALEIEAGRVTLHRTLIGGAFGSRLEQAHRHVIDAALLARELGQPVQVIWSRETDVRCGRYKPITAHYLSAGEDAQGRLVAWRHRLASDEPLAQSDPYRYAAGKGYPATSSPGLEVLYAIANVHCEAIRRDTGMRLSPMRGVGVPLNKFASESFVDEIAIARSVDPLALRLELLHGNPAAQAVLRAVAERANWRPGAELGLSFVDTHGTLLGTVAEVDVDARTGVVRARNVWAVIDAGIAVQPRNLLAQLEGAIMFGISNALKERIEVADGATLQSNYHDYRVLRMAEAPQLHCEIIASDRSPCGGGEIGVMGVVPAIANAVAARTGRRLRHLPLLPERVLAALGA